MAISQIFANSIGAGVRATITADNGVVVMADFTVGSTNDIAIDCTGFGNLVEVFGSVFAASSGVRSGTTPLTSAATDQIAVHQGGSIWGELNGISCFGFSNQITNAGSIGGGFSGVRFEVGSGGRHSILNQRQGEIDSGNAGIRLILFSQADATIDNLGSITGGAHAIFVDCSNTCDVLITNDGVIASRAGQAGVAIDTDSAPRTITIINAGKIIGDVLLGTSRDTVDTRQGDIRGDVSLGGGADVYRGGAFVDNVSAGRGKDVLTGGGGADAFVFALRSEGGDKIVDFQSADRFEIDASGFGGRLVAGALAAARFDSGRDNKAGDANDRFIFRTTDATLWFDVDGNGGARPVLIADLQAGARVTAGDNLLF